MVRSLMRRKPSNQVLFSIASVPLSLLVVMSSLPALAGKRIDYTKIPSRAADTPKVTTPSNAHTDLEVGMSEWLNQERVIFLSGEITPELAELVVSQLLYLDHKAPGKDIYLYINSEGGSIRAGLAIFDTIRSLQSDVVTVGLGEASSMGAFLLASGAKGKRVALPNTRIMIHQPWNPDAGGQASDIAISAKEILYLKNLLNRLLSEFTGQPLKRIETDSDRDFFMSADEAKAYGIIDKTINQLPSATRPLK